MNYGSELEVDGYINNTYGTIYYESNLGNITHTAYSPFLFINNDNIISIVFNETCEYGCTVVTVENNGPDANIFMSGSSGDILITNNKGLIVLNGMNQSTMKVTKNSGAVIFNGEVGKLVVEDNYGQITAVMGSKIDPDVTENHGLVRVGDTVFEEIAPGVFTH